MYSKDIKGKENANKKTEKKMKQYLIGNITMKSFFGCPSIILC